jgi:hypothetical protein
MYDDIDEGSVITVKLADGTRVQATVEHVGHADHGWAMLTLAMPDQTRAWMPIPDRMLASAAS